MKHRAACTQCRSAFCVARANNSDWWESQTTGQWIQVLKKSQSGFCYDCWSGWNAHAHGKENAWRLICCDSAFLVVVSTRLIIYSVTLFWTIASSLLRRFEGIVSTWSYCPPNITWRLWLAQPPVHFILFPFPFELEVRLWKGGNHGQGLEAAILGHSLSGVYII